MIAIPDFMEQGSRSPLFRSYLRPPSHEMWFEGIGKMTSQHAYNRHKSLKTSPIKAYNSFSRKMKVCEGASPLLTLLGCLQGQHPSVVSLKSIDSFFNCRVKVIAIIISDSGSR